MISYAARRTRLRPVLYAPPLTPAVVLWVGDRTATVDASGEHLDVVVPNGLWLRTGMRVGLFRYPDSWVAVGIYTTRSQWLPTN